MPRSDRPAPRELTRGWPTVSSENPIGEVARQFANNLRDAIGDRPVREVARELGMNHTVLRSILVGDVWPDLYTIARLEQGLGKDLWPGRPGN